MQNHLDHVFLMSLIYMTPLVGSQGIIVNAHHFYSRLGIIFDIFVKQLMLPTIYLANPQDISQTIDYGHCQHDGEEVCGVGVVVGASTWTLSS